MFRAADTWSERLCIAILAYLGPRRHAAALLTLRDYDQLRGRLRFHEKGGKTIWKPIPTELKGLIDSAIAAGAIKEPPDDYLIPPEGPLVRARERDDRVVWRLVKRIANKAGVEAHPFATGRVR
jgi:integrase